MQVSKGAQVRLHDSVKPSDKQQFLVGRSVTRSVASAEDCDPIDSSRKILCEDVRSPLNVTQRVIQTASRRRGVGLSGSMKSSCLSVSSSVRSVTLSAQDSMRKENSSDSSILSSPVNKCDSSHLVGSTVKSDCQRTIKKHLCSEFIPSRALLLQTHNVDCKFDDNSSEVGVNSCPTESSRHGRSRRVLHLHSSPRSQNGSIKAFKSKLQAGSQDRDSPGLYSRDFHQVSSSKPQDSDVLLDGVLDKGALDVMALEQSTFVDLVSDSSSVKELKIRLCSSNASSSQKDQAIQPYVHIHAFTLPLRRVHRGTDPSASSDSNRRGECSMDDCLVLCVTKDLFHLPRPPEKSFQIYSCMTVVSDNTFRYGSNSSATVMNYGGVIVTKVYTISPHVKSCLSNKTPFGSACPLEVFRSWDHLQQLSFTPTGNNRLSSSSLQGFCIAQILRKYFLSKGIFHGVDNDTVLVLSSIFRKERVLRHNFDVVPSIISPLVVASLWVYLHRSLSTLSPCSHDHEQIIQDALLFQDIIRVVGPTIMEFGKEISYLLDSVLVWSDITKTPSRLPRPPEELHELSVCDKAVNEDSSSDHCRNLSCFNSSATAVNYGGVMVKVSTVPSPTKCQEIIRDVSPRFYTTFTSVKRSELTNDFDTTHHLMNLSIKAGCRIVFAASA